MDEQTRALYEELRHDYYEQGDQEALAWALRIAVSSEHRAPLWVVNELVECFQDHQNDKSSHFGEGRLPARKRGKSNKGAVDWTETVDFDDIAGPRSMVYVRVMERAIARLGSFRKAAEDPSVNDIAPLTYEGHRQAFRRFSWMLGDPGGKR